MLKKFKKKFKEFKNIFKLLIHFKISDIFTVKISEKKKKVKRL